jgi:exosome complex RNA-binding protein Rrp42 (RNase PH superfamily)
MSHPDPSKSEQSASDVEASFLVAKAAIIIALSAAGHRAIAQRNTDDERAIARQSVLELAGHLQDCAKACLDIHQTLTEAQAAYDNEAARGVN